VIRIHRTAIGTVAALAVAVPAAVLSLAGCAATASHPSAAAHDDKYGSLPSYLPKDSIHPDSVLTGTATKPALTTEGDSVEAKFAGGSALVSVAGPEVPGEGLPYQAAATTCTWTVTITGTSGSVPVRPSDFSSIDHLGAIYRPALVAGQSTPPTALKPGQKATFELRAEMLVGEGLMRWAPDGKHIVGSWDFEVEND
jgi:hypothetical protein